MSAIRKTETGIPTEQLASSKRDRTDLETTTTQLAKILTEQPPKRIKNEAGYSIPLDFFGPPPSANVRCNVYPPRGNRPFQVSRTTYEKFLKCPLCFANEFFEGKQMKHADGFGLPVYSTVDLILKQIFDIYRAKKTQHPLMAQADSPVDNSVIPYTHKDLDTWRNNFKGIRHMHAIESMLLECSGAIDDIWINLETEELHIVDYKLTSSKKDPDLSDKWKQQYIRQIEFYVWLFRKNGFKIADTAYFVYYNLPADFENKEFTPFEITQYDSAENSPSIDSLKLHLKGKIIPHKMDFDKIEKDIEGRLVKMQRILTKQAKPEPSPSCVKCAAYYRRKQNSYSQEIDLDLPPISPPLENSNIL